MTTLIFGIRKRAYTCVLLSAAMGIVSGCSSLGGTGPTARSLKAAAKDTYAGAPIRIVELDGSVIADLDRLRSNDSFATQLGERSSVAATLGPGDALAISIYEAPPALLFGAFTRMGSSTPSAASPTPAAALPPVVVDEAGNVMVAFVGKVRAAGLTTSELAEVIRRRLSGKANDPQVMVSESGNASRTVTVLGETGTNVRIPLTAYGERLLDALASGDTLKQPVNKTTVQITRGERLIAMPLSAVIADPRQNVRLAPGDIVTALYKPYSFTALGSVKQSQEIEFEATGLSLAQALGRSGGLDERSADVRGLFVFRFEDPGVISRGQPLALPHDARGRVPVIYKLDLSKPTGLLIAQQFAMRDKDVIYVSRAPLVDLQNFVGVASQLVYTLVNVSNGLQQ